MTNPGFRPTASGVRFCSSLDLTETHFHLGKRAEEEQSSGCHLDFLSKPGCHTESILHSPHRWQHLSSALSPAPCARRWAAGDTLGCPGGAWHRHPMLPTIPLPAPLTGQQWGSCWASPKQHLGEMAAPRGLVPPQGSHWLTRCNGGWWKIHPASDKPAGSSLLTGPNLFSAVVIKM